jgi:DNA-directed RNA polymerase sigma subunit (sigma70/sigma32)
MPNKEYTLEEIGNYCGISRERVRQIEAKALNNLRSQIKQQFGWEMDLKDLVRDTADSYSWKY